MPSKIGDADCRRGLARRSSIGFPNGLDTPLGEGGGLVSGGEGQRVRLGRALLRPGVRLVILDEPFRGLDFEQRHKLLARAREVWRDATLLSISHDIAEALTFQRVLVMEDGRIVEDGDPRELARNPDPASTPCSKPKMPSAEELWNGAEWRHLSLHEWRTYLSRGCGLHPAWTKPGARTGACRVATRGDASPRRRYRFVATGLKPPRSP